MPALSASLPWQQPAIIQLSQRILTSFAHWMQRPLLEIELDEGSPEAIAQALFEAPFAVMAHGTEADPIFNYGNRMALERFGLDWEQFTRMPSRCSAEPIEQGERDRLLQASQRQGIVPNFKAVRVTQSGERFLIEDGILWNVLNEQGEYCGQAAIYTQWTVLPPSGEMLGKVIME